MKDLRRTALSTLSALARRALVALSLCVMSACASNAPPATANPGQHYVVTGNTPFYDSGCTQEKPTGALVKGRKFKLVSETSGCWLILFEDETETYISKPTDVRPADG